jgi:hypothetical protein
MTGSWATKASVVFLLASLTGCGGVSLPLPGSSDSLSVDSDGGTVTFNDSDSGTEIKAGENVDVPDGFPTDIPFPSGAAVSASAVAEETILVMLQWEGMTKSLFEQYIGQVEANGYAQVGDVVELDLGAGAFSQAVSLSNATHDVTISGFGDPAGIGQLTITVSSMGG